MLPPHHSLSVPVIILLTINILVSYGAKWTYTGPDGEHHWAKHYPFCGGAFQSPIDFQTPLLRYEPNLAPIELRNYNLSRNEQLTLSNNGHSVQLSLPSRMYVTSLPNRYSAAQMHLHWGAPSLLPGSEHTINGKQFAAELHIVHFNSDKYPNVSMAVDKSDGLAVLGVLIEVGEFNPAFEHFLKYINGIKYKDQKIQVPAFNIRDLLPSRLDQYYRYDGSLTTPPCYPSVLWTVFRNPVTFSIQQFQALASAMYSSSIQESAPVPLNGNYRKPQLTDNRVVLVSFQDGRALHGILKAATALQRRQVIQKLLVGDLADLADEGLYQLLPAASPKPRTTGKWKNTRKSQRTHAPGINKQRWQQNNLPSDTTGSRGGNNAYTPTTAWQKGTHGWQSVGKYSVNEAALCYGSLAERTERQLRGVHGQAQLTQALHKSVFPELNLRSYLACRSELDLETVRLLLRGRPSDEANELDHSLTVATMGRKKKPAMSYRASSRATTKKPMRNSQSTFGKNNANNNAYSNAYINAHRHNRIQPLEWED
ncbi:carbonic anhydrase 12 isoform X1 [Alosa sapidissima]|uniref:carbonic anhydrase 12 isoform X1 n=2 Tax=Alosa sapidissima TaxID=34773 RepID=UPI001C09E663|nr:carbonic anhydrase 12 isoform X1 [Alosa sapidissima]